MARITTRRQQSSRRWRPPLANRPLVIASLCGTDGDKQDYEAQRARLQAAGIVVAASNADAAEQALAIVTR